MTAALLAGTVSMPAAAVTIDFDTLPGGAAVADGTLIGTQYAPLGVTFSAVLGSNANLSPVATNYAAGQPGPNYSGNYLGNAPNGAPFVTTPVFGITPRYDILRLSFAQAVDNLSLSLNNFSLVGRTTFNAYGANGALLQSFTTNAGNGWSVRSLAVNGVTRLDLLNNVFNDSPTFFGIDQLRFDAGVVAAVPEPASWMLMIAGFGLVGGAMRRRRTAIRFA